MERELILLLHTTHPLPLFRCKVQIHEILALLALDRADSIV